MNPESTGGGTSFADYREMPIDELRVVGREKIEQWQGHLPAQDAQEARALFGALIERADTLGRGAPTGV